MVLINCDWCEKQIDHEDECRYGRYHVCEDCFTDKTSNLSSFF